MRRQTDLECGRQQKRPHRQEEITKKGYSEIAELVETVLHHGGMRMKKSQENKSY